MAKNISKPFVMTLSLINVDPLPSNYKCFYGEDVQLLVTVVDEFKRPVDLTDMACRAYYINNEFDIRQDENITITDAVKGKIVVIVKRNYIRIGENEVRLVLYDDDQEVHLQPTTIYCLESRISPSAPIPNDPEFDYKSQISSIKAMANGNSSKIGPVDALQTEYKTDLVGSINEIVDIVKDTTHLDNIDVKIEEIQNKQGNLTELPTNDKTNIVGSIKELNHKLSSTSGANIGDLSIGLKPPNEKWIPLDGSRYHESQYPDLYKYYGSPWESYKFEDYLTILSGGYDVDSYDGISYWYDGQMIIPRNVYSTTSTFALFDLENPEMNGIYTLSLSGTNHSYHRVASRITKIGDYYYTVLGTSTDTSSTTGYYINNPTVCKLQLSGKAFTLVASISGMNLSGSGKYYFDKNGNFITTNSSREDQISIYTLVEMEKCFAGTTYTPVPSYTTTFTANETATFDTVSKLSYSRSSSIAFPYVIQADDLSGNKMDYVLTKPPTTTYTGTLGVKILPCNNGQLFITIYTTSTSETHKSSYTYYLNHNTRICKLIHSKTDMTSNHVFLTDDSSCMEKIINISDKVYLGINFADSSDNKAIQFELNDVNDIINLQTSELTFYNDIKGTTINGISIKSSNYITSKTNIHMFDGTVYKQSFGGQTSTALRAFQTELTDRRYFKIDTVDKAKTYIRGLL